MGRWKRAGGCRLPVALISLSVRKPAFHTWLFIRRQAECLMDRVSFSGVNAAALRLRGEEGVVGAIHELPLESITKLSPDEILVTDEFFLNRLFFLILIQVVLIETIDELLREGHKAR